MNKNIMLKTLLTLGPIGYLPASGTCASLLTIPVAFVMAQWLSSELSMFVSIVGIFLSMWALAHCSDQFAQKDPSEIVIDEVCGCLLACFALPPVWWAWVLAFVFFRIGDISKFSIIGHAEKLPGAWGIMADDLVAGLLSNLCVHLIVYGAKSYSAF